MAELKFHVEGVQLDDGDVRLGAFIGQLKALQQALNSADEIVSHANSPTTYYRITGLKHESPAEVTLEAFPKDPQKNNVDHILGYFVKGIESIRKGEVLDGVNDRFLESVMALVKGFGDKYQRMWLETDKKENVELDKSLIAGIEVLLSKTMRSYGTITGRVEVFESHSEPHFFRLYHSYTGKAVKCIFPHKLLGVAIAAVRQRVTVYGQLKVRDKQFSPYECYVQKIDIHNSEGEMPSLTSLIGAAPDATGEESTFDFIRNIRGEWHH